MGTRCLLSPLLLDLVLEALVSTIDKEKQRHRIGMEKTQFAYDMMMYYKSTESFHQCSQVRK